MSLNLKNIQSFPHISITKSHNSSQTRFCNIQTTTIEHMFLSASTINRHSTWNKTYTMKFDNTKSSSINSLFRYALLQDVDIRTISTLSTISGSQTYLQHVATWSLKPIPFLLNNMVEALSNIGSVKRCESEPGASWLKSWNDLTHVIANKTEPGFLCIFLNNCHRKETSISTKSWCIKSFIHIALQGTYKCTQKIGA